MKKGKRVLIEQQTKKRHVFAMNDKSKIRTRRKIIIIVVGRIRINHEQLMTRKVEKIRQFCCHRAYLFLIQIIIFII